MNELLRRLELLKLTRLFALIERFYLVKDADGQLWLFKEHLDNGLYPRYTLKGKSPVPSGYMGANLFAKFVCRCCEESGIGVDVFIEDIVTVKEGVGLGSWMLNRLIEFLRTVSDVVPIREVYGDLVRTDPDTDRRVENFYRRFGFSIMVKDGGRKRISAKLSELHVVPLRGVEELNVEGILYRYLSPNSESL